MVFNGARSRPEVGDLSPWRKECRGACSGSLTICSLTPLRTKQHLILTKSPLKQVSLLTTLLWFSSISEMRSGKRRPRPRSRCLMARRMSRKHHDEGTSALRELNNSLPGNTIGDLQSLPCHLHEVKKHQLCSDSRHCRLTRTASADTNQCTWTCEGLNCQRLKLSLHLQVLVPRYQFRARLRIPLTRLL